MPTDVIMPALGMAQEKGTLIHWLKTEGESVVKGEPLMEVETDKAAVEVEAPASGTLAGVTASPGDEVPVGQRIALILAPGEAAAPAVLQDPRPLPEAKGRSKGRPLPEERRGGARPTTLPRTSAQSSDLGEKVLASPAARRIAREKGLDLGALKGTGPNGAVLAEDVMRAADAKRPAGQVVPLTAMRRVIAERMTHSKQTAPHFYLNVNVDMTGVEKHRARSKEQGAKIGPSINDWILWACAQALKDFPSLNSTVTDQGVRLFPDINIGLAVAVEDGLVVPVIRNADRLSLLQLAQQSRELAEKAQHKKLLPADYEGGTFTVSNLGMFGVESFVAIINPPQCAILAVGRVAPRVVPDGEKIAVRSMMTMTLSADHRIVDGVIGAKFLQEVKRSLENPDVH
jgi:pyruvate dehydrogenase E2 component (dihydrolipoamide acetyltransferase)